MFFVVRSNDSFNFPLGLIKYIVIVIIIVTLKIGTRFCAVQYSPVRKALFCCCFLLLLLVCLLLLFVCLLLLLFVVVCLLFV